MGIRSSQAFSIKEDVVSETLGPLHHGDLLSSRGVVVKSNEKGMVFLPQTRRPSAAPAQTLV